MTDQSEAIVICLNCQNEFQGRICSKCGQRVGISRLDLKEVFREIPRSFLYIEQKFALLLKDFFNAPVKTIKDYSEGKRKKYGSPFQYFYFFASLELIISGIYNYFTDEPIAADETGDVLLGFSDRFENAIDTLENLSDTIFYNLTIPIFLGILLSLLLRKHLNLAESIAFSYVFYSIIAIYWIAEELIYMILEWLGSDIDLFNFGLLQGLFLGYVFYRNRERKAWVGFIKGVFTFYLNYLFIGTIVLIYVILMVYLQ